MKIGIDGNEANVTQQVGVSVYTTKLLEYFAKNASESTQFIVYLRNQPFSHLPKETNYFKYRVLPGIAFWSQVFLPLELYLHQEINVFFSPAHYRPWFCPVPTVVTIHDLSYYYFPDEFLKKDLYKLQHWTERAVVKSKHVIAVSKNTKKDILKYFSIPESKVTVVYNGFEKGTDIKADTSTLLKFKIENLKFILYVGTVQPRKNIKTLLLGFDEFIKKGHHYKLIIVGKKGWLSDEIYELAQTLDSKDRIVFTGYLPDEQLVALYKNAYCYVLPSLYEGFGIPILEAFSYGCPVIASMTSSLPEIGGDACEYFDPQSSSNLTDRFIELHDNTKHRDNLIKKGRERIKEFSWTTCAESTLEILKRSV